MTTLSRADLVDITAIEIGPHLSPEAQRIAFVRQMKNLDHFLIGDVVIHAVHPKDGPTFQDCLNQLIE